MKAILLKLLLNVSLIVLVVFLVLSCPLAFVIGLLDRFCAWLEQVIENDEA